MHKLFRVHATYSQWGAGLEILKAIDFVILKETLPYLESVLRIVALHNYVQMKLYSEKCTCMKLSLIR